MLGLFGSLNLGARSLQNQQLGVEVAGHNLANVNNPAYSRQRVELESAPALPGPYGAQGTGTQVAAIQQLRSSFLDRQMQAEASITGYLEAQQQALELAQSDLGQVLDLGAADTGAAGTDGSTGLAKELGDLFKSFQSLSTAPASLTERQAALSEAQSLAAEFNQIDQRLGDLRQGLNDSLQSDVGTVNGLLADIARLNGEVADTENASGGAANDLRDLRQSKIEKLAALVKVDSAAGANGAVDVAIAGVAVVGGSEVLETLEAYDAGGGQWLVRARSGGEVINPASGSIRGTIDVRDGAAGALRTQLDTLAAEVITQVNAIHAQGYGLTGATGEAFFTGAGAGGIQVNQRLLDDPRLLQASGSAGESGNNQVALALAQLKDKKLSGLNGQTFDESYGQSVAQLGQSLASVNDEVETQAVVTATLQNQRDSASGVSLDEELTNLMQYQKAYQASARLITTVNEMLQTVLNM